MLKQVEITFLLKMNFGQGKVNIVHHCQELPIGGSPWRQVESSSTIQEIQKDGTCVVTPDLNRLFSTSESENLVPTLDDIMKVTSISDTKQHQLSLCTKYTARNIILIPPFMINRLSLVIQATQGNSKAALLEAIAPIHDFDEEIQT